MVLGSNGHLKLLDFGLCKQDVPTTETDGCDIAQSISAPNAARRTSIVGTPQYMAPESFKAEFSAASDLWALGIITFECLVGHVPFHAGRAEGGQAIVAVARKVKNYAEPEQFPRCMLKAKQRGFLTSAAEKFLQKLICDKSVRIDARGCRRDPFFFSIDFERVHEYEAPLQREANACAVESEVHEYGVSIIDDSVLPAPGPTLLKATCPEVPPVKDRGVDWQDYEFDCAVQPLQCDGQRTDVDNLCAERRRRSALEAACPMGGGYVNGRRNI